MSQRDSGYERKERDLYETPSWVTEALLPHIPERIKEVWEPACGSGKMVAALGTKFRVIGTDIEGGNDFLAIRDEKGSNSGAIITNPPYALASEFIWHAITLTCPLGFVAMLLRTDFDHAKTRLHLFQREQFYKKLVLTRRIRWIEGSTGSPSFNHAWFMWDWHNRNSPTIAYD